MTSQSYITAHPQPNSRDIRIAAQSVQSRSAQFQREANFQSISFAASAAAHTSATAAASASPPKSVNPHLGNRLDIKV